MIAIRFDGPPGPVCGRFIEVERGGASISFGKWKQDGDDWLLELTEVAQLEANLKWWKDNAIGWKEKWDEMVIQRDTAIDTCEMYEKEKPEQMDTILELAQRCLNVCNSNGWSREWPEVGAYLGLECAEYVEALRQGDQGAIVSEAADVLFVLLSSLANEDAPIPDVVRRLGVLADETHEESER